MTNQATTKWSSERIAMLKSMRENGLTYMECAKSLDVSYDSVEKKSRVLGLTDKDLGPKTKHVPVDNAESVVKRSHPTERVMYPDKFEIKGSGNVLVIGDTHIPFERNGYMEHCQRVRDQYNCTKIVHIGDEVDLHAISYHEHDPDGYSAGQEFDIAAERLRKWYSAFPEVVLTMGNHSDLPRRKARTNGLPQWLVKSYSEIWKAPPGWTWCITAEKDGVLYKHGDGYGGNYPMANAVINERQSCVIGHLHSVSGIWYDATRKDLLFGLSVGSGIDPNSYAMQYAAHSRSRPILSCAVVFDGGKQAIIEPMEI